MLDAAFYPITNGSIIGGHHRGSCLQGGGKQEGGRYKLASMTGS